MTAEGGMHSSAGEFHALGPVEDFPLNEIKSVQIDGRDVGVVRTNAGFFALGNRCPHQGGPLCLGRVTGTMLPSRPNEYVYGEEGLVVRCPWHGYEFHLRTGESVGGAVRGRAAVYPVEVRDGIVHCSLRRIARERRADVEEGEAVGR
jgi:nitrite reductase (NADH) small subunit